MKWPVLKPVSVLLRAVGRRVLAPTRVWTQTQRQIGGKALLFLCFALSFLAVSARSVSATVKHIGFYVNPHTPDPGCQIWFAGFFWLLERFYPQHQICGWNLYVWQVSVVLTFALLVLLAKCSLLVTAGAYASLLCLWLIFQDIAEHGHAIEAWAVVVCSAFLVGLAHWRGSKTDWLRIVLLGLALGYFPVMRQSAMAMVVLPVLLLICFWIAALAARRLFAKPQHTGEDTSRVATASVEDGAGAQGAQPMSPPPESCLRRAWPCEVRHIAAAVLFLACASATRQVVVRAWEAREQWPFYEHGKGYPLYLSLGFVRNPYNISWDDDLAMGYGILTEGVPWLDSDARAQRRLTQVWQQRVLEDPGLFLRGIAAKSWYVLQYFLGTLDPLATHYDGYPVMPTWAKLALLVGACLTIGWYARLLWRVRNRAMLALFAGLCGISAASLAPLLIVVPFYAGSFVALLLVLVFVFGPAVRQCAIRTGHRPVPVAEFRTCTRVYRAFFACCVAIAFAAAGYTAYRHVVNRRQARELLTADLDQIIGALSFRYASRFNRLDPAGQKTVIERLLDPKYRQAVYVPRHSPADANQEAIFRPVLAFHGRGVLFVVAHMSRNWTMLLPSRLQGPRNSAFGVFRNGDPGPVILRYFDSPYHYQKIADGNWDGHYRMFHLPETAELAGNTRFFNVTAFNFAAGSHLDGLELVPIAGGRLYRHDVANP